HFSFNSHFGACPACHGLGTELVCDPDLMIADPEKSLAEGAVTPWRQGPKRMKQYYAGLRDSLAKHYNVSAEIPFAELPEDFKKALFHGTGEVAIELAWTGNKKETRVHKPFEGLIPQLERLYETTESEFTKNRI